MVFPRKKEFAFKCDHVSLKNFRSGLCYGCWHTLHVKSRRTGYDAKQYMLNQANVTTKAAFSKRFAMLYEQLPPSDSYITTVWNHYKQLSKRPVTLPTMSSEVDCLLHALKPSRIGDHLVVLDPFCGTCSITNTVIDRLGLSRSSVITRDIKNGFDALNPCSWNKEAQYDKSATCIITSPPWELMDYVVPDLVRRAAIVAVHVASDYAVNYTAHRQQFISGMEAKGLVTRVTGLPKVDKRRRAMWLVMFKSTTVKSLCWTGIGDNYTAVVV